MNNTYRTDFENLRIPTLENVFQGIDHKVEVLQEKMSGDMGIKSFYNILPRNFSTLPIEKCSVHDIELLEELTAKRFDCFWTLEAKKAEEQGTVKEFEATFRFYSFLDLLNDEEINEFYVLCQEHKGHLMTSHQIIQEIRKNPNFLEEVMV